MTWVEMLWESCDPDDALVDRFGFDVPSAASWVSGAVVAHWNRPVRSVERLVLSGSNLIAWITCEDARRVVKVSCDPSRHDRLASAIDRVVFADACGIPVSVPEATAGGTRQVLVDGFAVSLQRVRPGPFLDVTVPEQVVAAGEALARLHLALARCPVAVEPDDPWNRPPAALLEEWRGWNAPHLPSAALERLRGLAAAARSHEPPRQVVHLDFRSANLLMVGDEVGTILDFEDAAVAAPVLDLARAGTLLGTRFREWSPISARVRSTFLAAYTRVRPLDAAERAWLPVALLWSGLAMIPDGDDPQGWGAAAQALMSDDAGSVAADPAPSRASGVGGDEGDR